jgi:hypothetical protein
MTGLPRAKTARLRDIVVEVNESVEVSNEFGNQ